MLADFFLGRSVLFLARAPGEETHDVWRGRVHVAPDGTVVDVADAHDLTNTPLGDDHALVVLGPHAAFATRVYGQEQSITVLILSGEGDGNKASTFTDRTMAALTNLQRTGTVAGVGRVHVTFDSPARAVGLELGPDTLEISVLGGDARHAATSVARVNLERRELVQRERVHGPE